MIFYLNCFVIFFSGYYVLCKYGINNFNSYYLEMVVPFVYTEEEYKKLEEERDFFKEQAILWRNDWKVAYEENRKLKNVIDTLMEKACIDRITLASWEVFLHPSKRLKESLEK